MTVGAGIKESNAKFGRSRGEQVSTRACAFCFLLGSLATIWTTRTTDTREIGYFPDAQFLWVPEFVSLKFVLTILFCYVPAVVIWNWQALARNSQLTRTGNRAMLDPAGDRKCSATDAHVSNITSGGGQLENGRETYGSDAYETSNPRSVLGGSQSSQNRDIIKA